MVYVHDDYELTGDTPDCTGMPIDKEYYAVQMLEYIQMPSGIYDEAQIHV